MMAGASKRKTIRLVGLAAGTPHSMSGQYVVRYDPDYHLPGGEYDGGKLIVTPDPHRATEFTFQEAILLWKSGPTCDCHRLRPDGKPNCPLMAFNVEIC